MIRGSTYPIDIISRSPLNWAEKWFDSGTGTLEIREQDGTIIATMNLDIFKVPNTTGRYRIFYTMPNVSSVVLQASGVVDSFPMRTAATTITIRRG